LSFFGGRLKDPDRSVYGDCFFVLIRGCAVYFLRFFREHLSGHIDKSITMALKKLSVCIIMITCLTLSGSALARDKTLSEAAERVSRSFFQMMDQGLYKQTYSLVPPRLRQIRTERQWANGVSSERESMGDVKSRRLVKVEEAENFLNLPKGKYLLAVYETSFTKQDKATEIMALVRSENGYGLAAYKVSYNKWPQALYIIGNGLFVVFFIMSLLAFVTWAMGKIFRKVESPNKKEKVS